MNQYIITDEGLTDLEKYFMEHKDDLFRIAWKNFKDKHISPYNPQAERERFLDKLDKWADSLPPYSGKDIPKVMLKGKIEEFRQDGEQG